MKPTVTSSNSADRLKTTERDRAASSIESAIARSRLAWCLRANCSTRSRARLIGTCKRVSAAGEASLRTTSSIERNQPLNSECAPA